MELKDQRLADLVFAHHSSAPVLEKYKLDFCCKGKRTLAQACSEQDIPVEEVVAELETVIGNRENPAPSVFMTMTPQQLADYIVARHHVYVRQAIPQIVYHLDKVYHKHGERYAYVSEVYTLFRKVAVELEQHMLKEEKILFPMMANVGQMSSAQLAGPIHVMEAEHEEAGDLLARIREITHDYTPPEDACTTHRLMLEELKGFEVDLHEHVHLENHLLFPRAIAMTAN
ncbi:MAG TPA: iron-sulfur cluster repair di-iron protein [Chitinophagaceae bacterium]|nr:iron-sulfur cluster repair di-iron protein [Chitinophagaceae bacterium]